MKDLLLEWYDGPVTRFVRREQGQWLEFIVGTDSSLVVRMFVAVECTGGLARDVEMELDAWNLFPEWTMEDMSTDRYWEACRESDSFIGRTILQAVAHATEGYVFLNGGGEEARTWHIPESRWEEFKTLFGSRFVPFTDVEVGFADVRAYAEEAGVLVEAPY